MSAKLLSKMNFKTRAVLLLLLMLLTGTVSILYAYFYKHQLAMANESNSLTVTGTIEAKTVMASFKVPGKIDSILVKEGSAVEKGQELAVLDSREMEAKLLQAEGAYDAATGVAQQAGSNILLTEQSVDAAIKQAQAVVSQAEVGLTDAQQKYQRVKTLYEGGAASDSTFDEASNNLAVARSKVEAAQGKLNEVLAAQIKVQLARAQYEAAIGQSKQAEGAVQEAQAYLDNTHLYSPISGYITAKMLEEGEMLNAGTPVFEITDLEHSYVKVFIDEKKIGRVRLNQEAMVKVEAYPEKVFRGKVVWINDAGEFAVHKAVNEQYNHDIRSFEVKIDLPNEFLELKTGMTATVSLIEEEKK